MNQLTNNGRTLRDAGQNLHRYAARFGFDRIAYVSALQRDVEKQRWTSVSIIGKDATSSIAVANVHTQCPIGRYCLSHEGAFAWRYSDPRFFRQDLDDSSRLGPVGKFMRKFQVGGAVTTPLRRTPDCVGIVSWLTSDPDVDLQSVVDRNGAELRLRAKAFLESIPTYPKPQADRGNQGLTPRELECLRWTALGKTTDEIGELISRSGETARFHLKSAVRKLGANSRIHAVARVSYFGILGDVS